MNRLMKKGLPLVLTLVMMLTMCFGSVDLEEAHGATPLTKEKPVFVVTGTGVVDAGQYTKDTILNEKAYTLEELKTIANEDPDSATDDKYLYSTLNTWNNNWIYNVRGVRVDTVLAKSDVRDFERNKFTFTAADKYEVVFDPFDRPDKVEQSTALGEMRYYYPNIGTDKSEVEKEPVPTTITWAKTEKTGEHGSVIAPPEDSKVKPHNNGSVKLAVGQLDPEDCNNPLWNGESAYLIATVGDKLTPQITIAGKAYNRAEILAKEFVKNRYTYESAKGTKTAYTKGVLVSDFLKSYADNDKIVFTCADNNATITKTKKELVDGDYMLAYEKGDVADRLTPIYEEDEKTKGFFTLYGNGEKPSKFINNVSVTLEAPKAPTSVKAARTSYSSIKVTWAKRAEASGYVIYRYDAKTKAYKTVKTITDGDVTSWTNTGLKTGTKYTYRIKARRSASGTPSVYSAYSSAAAATPSLSKPSLTKVTAGKKRATVKWKKTSGANGYKIYRATSKKGRYKVVKTIKKGTTTSYKNTKLKKGKKYYYKIKAYRIIDRKNIYSSYSTVKYAKVK